MATIVCDCDSCKYHKNGGCELAVIEICEGHCRDLDGNRRTENAE